MRRYLRGQSTWRFRFTLKCILIAVTYLGCVLGARAAPPCIVYLSKVNPNRMLQLTAMRDGSTVGKMVYCYTDGDCHVAAMVVDHSSRRTGVSTDLIQHMLEREPEAQSISAVLVLDNYRASGLGALHRDATFDECAAAVLNTPLVRTATRFGFRKIVQCAHLRRADMISIKLEEA